MVVYGDKEAVEKNWKKREERQREFIEKICNEIDGNNRNWANEITQIRRLGKFKEGRARPIRVRFTR